MLGRAEVEGTTAPEDDAGVDVDNAVVERASEVLGAAEAEVGDICEDDEIVDVGADD